MIIQLGDVHFSDFKDSTTDVDTHDRSTPGRLDSTLGLPIPRAVAKAIVDQLNESPDALVAICGDITSYGNRQDFEGGVEYLAGVLADPLLSAPPHPDRVHLVPGNHDISFKDDQPFVSFEDVSRFKVLADICIAKGLGTLSTTHRHTTVTSKNGAGGLSVVSVNTCRGAGATRRDLPGGARDALLEAAVAEAGNIDLEAALERHAPQAHTAEVLDVPLLHPEEIQAISTHWGGLDVKYLPVLLAHHGLLPQHTPRLNPYTEMANAGQARKEIAKLGRSILYLHGHIHQHVVEVVDFPKPNDALPLHERAVIVAAPELKHGFNKIAVKFGASGVPQGVRVEKYRIGAGEQTVSREPDITEVSLARRPTMTTNQRKILEFVVRAGSAAGSELVDLAETFSPLMSKGEVEALVETLCWSGVLRRNSAAGTSFVESGFIV